LHGATDVDEVVGDDAEADPAVHSDIAMSRQSQPWAYERHTTAGYWFRALACRFAFGACGNLDRHVPFRDVTV